MNSRPYVDITSPGQGDTISDTISVTGSAHDADGDSDVEVVYVRIYYGGWDACVGTSSWSYSWDTTSVDDGDHKVYAMCYDGDLFSLLSVVTVNVSNNKPPTVTIMSPSEDDLVQGNVLIEGVADDPNDVETLVGVEVKIDNGGWETVVGTTIWSYSWNTSMVSEGVHTIYARSFDGVFYSDEYSVNVIVAQPNVIIESVSGGFRVNVNVKNTGMGVAYDVPWSIDLEGGFIIVGGTSNDVIPELGTGRSVSVRLSSLFGVFRTSITVNVGDVTETASGFMLGPLVLNVQEL